MSNNHKNADKDKRCFIRHPVSLTVQCRKQGHVDATPQEMRDISFGGMLFVSQDRYQPGDIVDMEFPPLTLRNRVTGEVIWSAPVEGQPPGRYANGLKFLSRSVLFMARLVEQMCCIERYRQTQVQSCHRALTADQAANEWIHLCAARFPSG